MATEALYIPEERLAETIKIIRKGLQHTKNVSASTRAGLLKWCKEEEDYLKRMAAGDDDE